MLPENSTSIYFDNNASTNLSPPVIEDIQKLIASPLGNPSSAHSYADYSRRLIRESRSIIAQFLHCPESSVLFNSGATEGNTTVLQSLLAISGAKKLITTKTEHASIWKNAEYLESQGIEVDWLDVDANGIIDIEQYKAALKSKGTKLASVIWANGETGVLQNIPDLALLAKERGALFHTDASQAIGRIEIDLDKSEIDFLTFTGHKLHAPKGIGVLFARNQNNLSPLLLGGDQESKLRAGTENVLHIHSLAVAIDDRFKNWNLHINSLKNLRDSFESKLMEALPHVEINGSSSDRAPNTSNVRFTGIDGPALLAQLDIANLYCSQTSACTSMMPEPSRTLRVMGLSEDEAFSSLRFSFAITNTLEEIYEGIFRIGKAAEKLH